MTGVANLFSEEVKLQVWTSIELYAAEAQAPPSDAARLWEHVRVPTPQEVAEREMYTDHDVAAFVDCLHAQVHAWPGLGKWIHRGLTSSDVVDTAQCFVLAGALLRILTLLPEGQDRRRIQHARAGIAVGKLSGVVGSYGNVSPDVEAFVCKQLGLTPVPSTQVISRDRHAEVVFACALLSGDSRWVSTALENVALWHERDLSHSAVERIMLPDALEKAWEAARARLEWDPPA